MKKKIESTDYLRLLEKWVKNSLEEIYTPSDRRDLACYGTGYNSWGVQTNQKALAAWAILATSSDLDEGNACMKHGEILDYALRMLRFSLESHIEGSYQCTDGQKWGHTWISGLGTERVMHAIEALENHMTDNDKQLLKKVLLSECDWLMKHHPVVGDPDGRSGKNVPESNLWNGALLHRTTMMYPDAPRADEYKEKGTKFLVNSISIASDKNCTDIIDGKAIAEWHVGANFFDSFALHHHAYLNVGYMVICLSNIAMLHFSYRKKGLAAPEALYHHAYDLWKLIKMCTFPDGRLCRIGGDTRARYCYCQDYALPMWLFMIDKYGETDCLDFEKGWLELVKKEVEANADGSFLSERGETLKGVSPLYYTRLESDRAVTLSMGAHWRNIFEEFSNSKISEEQSSPQGEWNDDFHCACLSRSENRIASWVWESAEKPQGLCIPANRSDMAEWRTNLFARISGAGSMDLNDIISHSKAVFDGGFVTNGSAEIKTCQLIAEGPADEIVATQQIVYAALPDDTSVVCLQYVETLHRVYLDSIKGLFLNIPNDIFNGKIRSYVTAEGALELKGCPGKEEILELNSNWLNVDDCLSVATVYGGNITIFRPKKRQICIRSKERGGGFLYVDEICCPHVKGLKAYEGGEVIVDTGFIIQAGVSAEATGKFVSNNNLNIMKGILPEKVRAVSVIGTDGTEYILVANFGKEDAAIYLDTNEKEKAVELSSGKEIKVLKNQLELTCAPGSQMLVKLI
jgi:hypothetical protein